MTWKCTTGNEIAHVIDPDTGKYVIHDGQRVELFVYFVIAEGCDGERWRTVESWDCPHEAEAQAKRLEHWIEYHNLTPATSRCWRKWRPALGTWAYDDWQAGGCELAWIDNVEQRAVSSEFYRMASW